MVVLDNEVKNHVCLSETFVKLCTHYEANEVYSKDKTVKVYRYDDFNAALKFYNDILNSKKGVKKLWVKQHNRSYHYLLINKSTKEKFYYFGSKVGKDYNLNNHHHFKINHLESKQSIEDKIEKVYKNEGHSPSKFLYYICGSYNGEIHSLKTASDIFNVHSQKKVHARFKFEIKLETLEELKELQLLSYRELYIKYLKRKFGAGSKIFFLKTKKEKRVVNTFERLCDLTIGLREKDDYSLLSFSDEKDFNLYIKKLNYIKDRNPVFVDASLKKGRGQFKILTCEGDVYKSEKMLSLDKEVTPDVLELLAVYEACRKYDRKVYCDCFDVVQATRHKGTNLKLAEEYKKKLSQSKSKKVYMKALQALDYFLDNYHTVCVNYWNQKELGTNPAHFKVS